MNYICGMKTTIFSVIFFAVTSMVLAQQPLDTTLVDYKYKEDQFYFSITYELLGQKPSKMKQSGFSSGINFGVIKDMPFNERRNKAFGVGLGLSVNSYNQNMLISEGQDGGYLYEIINTDFIKFKRNKFTTYLIEMPLEYRWRTSTAKDYKFWRVYAGVKFGYMLYNSTKFLGSSIDNVKLRNIDDFNKLQYGLTLSAGYSTWNFHVYYGLNSIFSDKAQLDGQSIKMNSIKVGLIFYVF